MNDDHEIRCQRATALVIAGAMLLIPANILPVMTITVTGDVEHLTILGGVQELADSGMEALAALVFVASFVMPFLKLGVLSWLLAMDGSDRMRGMRTTLFRLVRLVGTWSMIDLFLLSVLAAVGQLGILASVEAQPGAAFFAAVLLCSLFAAENYSVRMIWETREPVPA